MVFEWVAEAAEVKRCGFWAVNGQLSRIGRGIAFLIALIVRRRGVIFCKHR
jgi:hypothetical protein